MAISEEDLVLIMCKDSEKGIGVGLLEENFLCGSNSCRLIQDVAKVQKEERISLRSKIENLPTSVGTEHSQVDNSIRLILFFASLKEAIKT